MTSSEDLIPQSRVRSSTQVCPCKAPIELHVVVKKHTYTFLCGDRSPRIHRHVVSLMMMDLLIQSSFCHGHGSGHFSTLAVADEVPVDISVVQ